MKRKYLILPTVLSLIILLLSLQLKVSIHNFNTSAVIRDIQLLSSDTFKGRLAGSLENESVANTLKTFMEKEELKPFIGDYYHKFTTKVPYKVQGSPYLNVTDIQGKTIREFQYGEDYKEDMLNFRINSISFNRRDEIGIQDKLLQVGKNSNYFLFYVPKDNSFKFRSSFLEDSVHSMYIMITAKTFTDITDYLSKGYTINCFIPYEAKSMDLNNVAGFIQGSSPSLPPIVISAHFDHMGSDFSGTEYPGALDNASGVAFVMELERYLHSLGQPNQSILFVFFNGEELGCRGSTDFAKEYETYLKDSKILNFDMIGSNQNLPLSLMAGEKDSKSDPLIKELSTLCTSNNINYDNLFQDSSDHEAFRKENIEAVTFCNNDLSRIHTPQDTVNFINPKAINSCFIIASKEIIKSAYLNTSLLLHTNEIFKYSLLCFILLLCFHLIINFDFR